MKRFHITYYLENTDYPTLSGVTIEAEDMILAINIFINREDTPDIDRIKYVIEL